MMRKLPDWQILLHKFLTKNRDREFGWGTWDCCTFCNEALKVISGQSVIPPQLQWSNECEAMEKVQKYGRTFSNAIKKAARAAGLKPVDVKQITAGDLVVYQNENEEVCGICDGFSLLSPSDIGYAFSRCEKARLAWRVPDG